MLITCPSCASSFRIDIDRVGPEGRSVRCGACREPWFVSPEEVLAAQMEELGVASPEAAEPAAEPDPAPAEAATDAPVVENVPPAPRRPVKAKPRAKGKATKGKPLAKGLPGLSPATAIGLAILAAVPLACLARVTVVRALPQTAGLYARIGLAVNLRGLELRDVVASRTPADAGRPAELLVEGDLVGVARGDSPVPPIEVALRDAADHTVGTFPIPAPRPVLGEGETARFRARFPDPPAAGRSIEVRFANGATRQTATKADAGDHAPAADPHAAPAPSAKPESDHGSSPAPAAQDHAPAHGH